MRILILFFCFFTLASFIFAQSEEDESTIIDDDTGGGFEDEALISEGAVIRESEDAFWISLGPETAMYSNSNMCFGLSLAFAYGKRVSIGFKTAYFFNPEDGIDVLELGFLLRFYLLSEFWSSALFVQLSGGHSLFIRNDDNFSIPAQWGTMHFGVNVGWRLLFGNVFFVESFVRGGYPYLLGGGISAGAAF